MVLLGRIRVWRSASMLALLLVAVPAWVAAQEAGQETGEEDTPSAAEAAPSSEEGLKLSWSLEAKANFRHSDLNRFPVNFPFKPEQLPVGQTQGFEETVNAGSHFEVSAVTLLLDAAWSEGLAAHAKVDFLDLYERNPTGSDKKMDVDEIWIRFGRETLPAALPEKSGVYLKIGKFPHFERQNDRHLESYGLVSTAFNRLEDAGAELGVDLGRHVYLKASATQGNPVFIRDPNALAGDNGNPAVLRFPNPDPKLKTGVVILYDAEVEDLDVDGDLELGGGVGVRFGDDAGINGVDVLAWGYERTLADTVELDGTFYGGDLDLLDGPGGLSPLPVTSDKKREVGANLWLYRGGLSFFAQYVDQDLGGLPRIGYEAELAWRFDLPLRWAAGGGQILPFVAPSVRYSKLDNDFRFPTAAERPPGQFPPPNPSVFWDWEKLDAGVRVGIVPGTDLTLEYAANRFILGSGAERENDEALVTLRWRM